MEPASVRGRIESKCMTPDCSETVLSVRASSRPGTAPKSAASHPDPSPQTACLSPPSPCRAVPCRTAAMPMVMRLVMFRWMMPIRLVFRLRRLDQIGHGERHVRQAALEAGSVAADGMQRNRLGMLAQRRGVDEERQRHEAVPGGKAGEGIRPGHLEPHAGEVEAAAEVVGRREAGAVIRRLAAGDDVAPDDLTAALASLRLTLRDTVALLRSGLPPEPWRP
jgi:hypothetical protein